MKTKPIHKPSLHFKHLLFFAVFLMIFSSGCAVKKIALNSVARALTNEKSLVFSGDDDPELVGQALPFALKTYESLLEKTPRNKRLLITTGKSFVMYAFAFVQIPAEQMDEDQIELQKGQLHRAAKLYLRGRGYLMRALDIAHPGISDRLLADTSSSDTILSVTTLADTSLLYWTAMAWMGAITAEKGDIGLMVTMPAALSLMTRLNTLDSTYGDGALCEFFLSYYGALPPSMGGSEEKARKYFNRAIALSNGGKAGPYVSLASSVCVRNQNASEFRDLLAKASNVDVSRRNKYRLTNIIYQQKALWMLKHIDHFFVDSEN